MIPVNRTTRHLLKPAHQRAVDILHERLQKHPDAELFRHLLGDSPWRQHEFHWVPTHIRTGRPYADYTEIMWPHGSTARRPGAIEARTPHQAFRSMLVDARDFAIHDILHNVIRHGIGHYFGSVERNPYVEAYDYLGSLGRKHFTTPFLQQRIQDLNNPHLSARHHYMNKAEIPAEAIRALRSNLANLSYTGSKNIPEQHLDLPLEHVIAYGATHHALEPDDPMYADFHNDFTLPIIRNLKPEPPAAVPPES